MKFLPRSLLLLVVTVALFCFVTAAAAAPSPRYMPKHRPYAGIGIVTFTTPHHEKEKIILYEEPGLLRTTSLDLETFSPPYSHVFGNDSSSQKFIVTARRQEWLKVIYDDAGREGWLNRKTSSGEFYPYTEWLRQVVVSPLAGLHKSYYELLQTRKGKVVTTLNPKQQLKIIAVDDNWAQVLTAQNQIGWIRWKDDDGRLLIGLTQKLQGVTP